MISVKQKKTKTWVTFTFHSDTAVSDVALCGEWNSWQEEPMKQKKNGDYYLTKVLKPETSFEFGYKVNNAHWHTDESCQTVPSPFMSQNSLLEL
jgi:hypothetical protein